MQYRLTDLSLPLSYKEDDLISAVARKIRCNPELIRELTMIRRSIDARNKPKYTATVEFTLNGPVPPHTDKFLKPVPDKEPAFLHQENKSLSDFRPVIVGAGPAGLMAALVLIKYGAKPVLVERGEPAKDRAVRVADFWQTGAFSSESNVLFGEGGAGLFSDGKLTARSKDRRAVRFFFETLVSCGAPTSLLIDAEPHLGTDRLKQIIPHLRKAILDGGGEIQYQSKAELLHTENGKVSGIQVNGKDISADTIILATGHSARDTYQFLADAGVTLEPKPFAIGVRLEIPQKLIDQTQWGQWAGHPGLEAASFRLTRRPEKQIRACYSFCMCPGGTVIPCASSEDSLFTNGMSNHARSNPFGNAAFLVPVGPTDFEQNKETTCSELAGCGFQEKIEKAVYVAGGRDYSLPAERLSDFLSESTKPTVPENRSFQRIRAADLHAVLPNSISRPLIHAIPRMLQIFRKLRFEDVAVYAAETRSSSPVRIVRNENGESVGIKGLFPCGEGAGYAGGIVSSAVDGIRTAESAIRSCCK